MTNLGERSDSQRLATIARYLLSSRRRRDRAFAGVEFGEPVWNIILDLYVSHVEGRQSSIYNLCSAAAAPPTTAFRWINVMVNAGHFIRQPDAADRRRVLISFSPNMLEIVEAYLAAERHAIAIALGDMTYIS